MKIYVEGSSHEIGEAKAIIEGSCFFNSIYCRMGYGCSACERDHPIIVEYKEV